MSIDGNNYTVNPLWTKNERWEEQQGYSPSTVAAVITGLVVAANIARNAGQAGTALLYSSKADQFVNNIDRSMFTTQGRTLASVDGCGPSSPASAVITNSRKG